MRRTPLLALLICVLPLFATAHAAVDPASIPVGSAQIHLRYAQFDPLLAAPVIPPFLKGGPDTHLWIVQLVDSPTETVREQLRVAGASLQGYLPDNAYVARMSAGAATRAAALPAVRWVGYYEPAFRIDPLLLREFAEAGGLPSRKYNIVVVDKHQDKPALIDGILGLGGDVTHEQPGSILLEVRLDGPQLLAAARLDQVLWIDLWSAPELDMNNARIQGGGNYVEGLGGFTGTGVNGHIYEGLEASHVDWNKTPINVQSAGGADSHGHCTAGIICGNGTSHPNGRGMAPDIQMHFTQYSTVTSGWSRWMVIQDLVNTYKGMFTSASWGGSRTFFYTSTSADTDDIIFDNDIPWTQSQSNAGNQDSRPEAWAKNIFSIGGVYHYDNSNPLDDSWAAGGGSTGPAADGRIKPDLCAYYDNITCSAVGGSYTTTFGGTSGATPICGGHNALAIQMFTDGTTHGLFNNPLRVPGGTRFQNRPHTTTLKALQIANAAQYAFTSTSSDNRREHCGWGFPDLKSMYDNRNVMFIVDEEKILTQGQTERYMIRVTAGQPELKVAMTYSDPAGNPSAAFTRINNLDLRVTSPSGTLYWGNNGLKVGNYSVAGGSADDRDTVECVFVKSPEAGDWKVDVSAPVIAMDSHVETTPVDADFGLVVNGGVYVGTGTPGSTATFGKGCPGSAVIPGGTCGGVNINGGTSTASAYGSSILYAYEYTTYEALQVIGFRLFTGAAGTASSPTAFYLSGGSGPAATPVATSTIQVGTAIQFYDSNFSQVIQVPAGTTFYVTCDHAQIYRADLTSGTGGTAYYKLPTSSSWGVSGFLDIPSFQIICLPVSGATPELSVSGAASIGMPLTLNLTKAAPNRLAFLFTGKSDTAWGGYPLPYNLAGQGAPLCNILVSLDIAVAFPTDSAGNLQLAFVVPSNPAIVGVKAYQQFAVSDPSANVMGAAWTNAIAITIGD